MCIDYTEHRMDNDYEAFSAMSVQEQGGWQMPIPPPADRSAAPTKHILAT